MAQKDALANAYGTAAPYGGLAGGDPGATGAATNELAAPHTRQALAWSTASGTGVINGTATFNVGAGQTVAWFFVASSNVAAAATVRDTYDVTDQVFASAGTYSVTVSYTQS